MLNVSIVLYQHRESEITKVVNCVLQSKNVSKLFLIDNSPAQSTFSFANNDRIQYVYNNSNIGYGAAHNIALKKSINYEADYHLVLNPDVYFKSGTLEKLIAYMNKNRDVGNVMPEVRYPDGTLQFLCKLLPSPYDWIGRRFNPFINIVKKRNDWFELQFTKYNKIMDVPYLSGCFMFLRVDAIKKIGLFDERIFMYGEETDLCRRIIKGGYRTVFYPEACITHEFQKGSHKSWRLTWIGIQSAIYYFNKWGWIFDEERNRINKNALEKLGYTK